VDGWPDATGNLGAITYVGVWSRGKWMGYAALGVSDRTVWNTGTEISFASGALELTPRLDLYDHTGSQVTLDLLYTLAAADVSVTTTVS